MAKTIRIRAIVDGQKMNKNHLNQLAKVIEDTDGLEILDNLNIERSKGDEITVLTLGIAVLSGTAPAIISILPTLWQMFKPKFEITISNEKTGVTLTGSAESIEKLEEVKKILQKMAEE